MAKHYLIQRLVLWIGIVLVSFQLAFSAEFESLVLPEISEKMEKEIKKDGRLEKKISGLLQMQVQLKKSYKIQPTPERLNFMNQMGLKAEEIDKQMVFIHAKRKLSPLNIASLKEMGVTVHEDSWIPPLENHPTGFVTASMPIDRLYDLARKTFVVRLETAEQILLPKNDEAAKSIYASNVWENYGYTGSGVRIAVLDSGLDTTHKDIHTPVASKDYSNYPSFDDTIENTVTEHGTHVTGSALGRGTQSSGKYKGIAYGTDLIFLKIGEDKYGGASDAAITAAIKATVDTYDADIVTISYGGYDTYNDGSDENCQAVDYAFSKGALVLMAAGNEASDNMHYSGTVTANSTTDYIKINVGEVSWAALVFWLKWFDGKGKSNDLDLSIYDANWVEMTSDVIKEKETESSRRTEAKLVYYNYIVYPNNTATYTYYLKVKNNSSEDQYFHIYSNDIDVTFENADPGYTIGSPAIADNAIAVASYTTRTSWKNYKGISYSKSGTIGEVSSFSSRGPRIDGTKKPDIATPGEWIISARDKIITIPGYYDSLVIDNDGTNNGTGPADYLLLRGTSMACPIAAGAAALLMQANPSLKGYPEIARNALCQTASNNGNQDNTYGYGKMNISSALNLYSSPTPTPSSTPSPTPTPASTPSSSVTPQIAAGGFHTIALKSDGTVWACGGNYYGQLGDGSYTNKTTPVQISGLSGIIDIASGYLHTIALKSDGTVWAWGLNYYGQLGDGTTTLRTTPVQVSGLSGVIAIACGNDHTVALKSDGTVWAWGLNDTGQLGDGTTTNRSTPVQVSGISGVTVIASGNRHTIVLKSDGTVWVWGHNEKGQLGDGTTIRRTTPVQVSSLRGVIAVAGGVQFSLTIKSDGTVWAWGENSAGELGDGTTTQRTTPGQVSGLSGVVAIAAGYARTTALKSDGTVWSWGWNSNGQLGDGTYTQKTTPVQVSGLSGVSAIVCAYWHTIALKSDGTVWAWGHNGYGQLGDGTTTQRTTPVRVSGLNGVSAITGGIFYTSVLKSNGTVWAWGWNDHGQLGDGTTTDRTTPVQVSGLSDVSAFSGGYWHAIALKSDGTVWAWGDNENGQLGDGTTTDRTTPVQVNGLNLYDTTTTTPTPSPSPTPTPTPSPTLSPIPTPKPTPSPSPTPTTGVIAGIVIESVTTAPISGATVSTDTGGYNATTDANGNYVIPNVAAGYYTVIASATGYTSVSVSVMVWEGGVTNVNFTLSPTAISTPAPSPTPIPIACEAESIVVSPSKLILKRKKSGNITISVTGVDNCPVEGENVGVLVAAAGKKYVTISPTLQRTDENGEATFRITAKKKAGIARIVFKTGILKRAITVRVMR